MLTSLLTAALFTVTAEIRCNAGEDPCALAEFHARQAWAAGRKNEAAALWRKSLVYHQHRVAICETFLARCGGDWHHELAGALAMVAQAQANLAEATGKQETVILELEKVAMYWENEFCLMQRLHEREAATDADLEDFTARVIREVSAIRARQEAARRILSRTKPPQ